VSVHDKQPDAVVMLVSNDDTSAAGTVASLGTLLSLAGQGGKIVVAQSTIDGVAVTTVTINDVGSLLPSGAVPGLSVPTTGPVSFSMAARGKVLYLTSGAATMTSILGVAAGSSLADDATFKLAGTRGLANSRFSVYVAAGATLDLVSGFLSAADVARWQSDIKPYVDPLESVSITSTADSTASRSRTVISVTKP
jgi:hypothetical protein